MATCAQCGTKLGEGQGVCAACGATVATLPRDDRVTRLLSAVAGGDLDAIVAMLAADPALATSRATDSWHKTPLHIAAAMGSSAIARCLLDHGADPNARDDHGCTPLIIAVNPNDGDGTEVVRVLLELGADPNLCEEGGETPLILAGWGGRADIARLLLLHGANVHAQDDDGYTAMQAASAGKDQQHLDTMAVLREFGSDPAILGYRPPRIEAALEELRAKLVQRLFRAIEVGNIQAVRSVLIDDPDYANVRDVDWENRTALHAAASGSDPDMVEILLAAGAEVNSRDVGGLTPLHLAVAQEAPSNAVVRILLEHGANPNVTTVNDLTPLHFAIVRHDPEVVKTLLGHGARLDISGILTESRVTPLELAEEMECPGMLALLLVHGTK